MPQSETAGPPQLLRCEYLIDPIGIDDATPRLSWEVNDSRRGAVQSAYQILAASTRELLDQDEADVWDSGKVESDQSAHVKYAGPALTSKQRV